jgi:hypothetical protein
LKEIFDFVKEEYLPKFSLLENACSQIGPQKFAVIVFDSEECSYKGFIVELYLSFKIKSVF